MRIFTYIFLLSTCIGLGQNYDINKPDKICVLPGELHEVSDVTLADSSRLACVQDENGFIYILDPASCKVSAKYAFAGNGDYEGIACAGNTMYVLRSDGVLFEVVDYTLKTKKVIIHHTAVPANNNEGLCYDEGGNRLLIGCKTKSGKGPEYKYYREIYAFDLRSKKLSSQPLYKIEVNKMLKAAEQNGIPLPVKQKKHGAYPVLRFTISALAIHPVTKQLYVISSADKLVFVFGRNGNVEEILKMDPGIHNKPEGIIFMNNGNMIITNEGQDGKPTVLTIASN